MPDSSLLTALDIYAGMGARQKTWYYEVNVLASLGVRICLLSLAGLTLRYLYGDIRPYDAFCYFQPVLLACLCMCTFAFWRLRRRFESDNGLTEFRQFIRLHSRLTFFDSY